MLFQEQNLKNFTYKSFDAMKCHFSLHTCNTLSQLLYFSNPDAHFHCYDVDKKQAG